MILETPALEQEIWAEEIKLLYSMVGKESEDPELLAQEKNLQELGRADREKQLDVLRRKAQKAEKPARRKRKRDTRGTRESEDESEKEESDVG